MVPPNLGGVLNRQCDRLVRFAKLTQIALNFGQVCEGIGIIRILLDSFAEQSLCFGIVTLLRECCAQCSKSF